MTGKRKRAKDAVLRARKKATTDPQEGLDVVEVGDDGERVADAGHEGKKRPEPGVWVLQNDTADNPALGEPAPHKLIVKLRNTVTGKVKEFRFKWAEEYIVDWNNKEHIDKIRRWRTQILGRAQIIRRPVKRWSLVESAYLEVVFKKLLAENSQRDIRMPTDRQLENEFNLFFGQSHQDSSGNHQLPAQAERKAESIRGKINRTNEYRRAKAECNTKGARYFPAITYDDLLQYMDQKTPSSNSMKKSSARKKTIVVKQSSTAKSNPGCMKKAAQPEESGIEEDADVVDDDGDTIMAEHSEDDEVEPVAEAVAVVSLGSTLTPQPAAASEELRALLHPDDGVDVPPALENESFSVPADKSGSENAWIIPPIPPKPFAETSEHTQIVEGEEASTTAGLHDKIAAVDKHAGPPDKSVPPKRPAKLQETEKQALNPLVKISRYRWRLMVVIALPKEELQKLQAATILSNLRRSSRLQSKTLSAEPESKRLHTSPRMGNGYTKLSGLVNKGQCDGANGDHEDPRLKNGDGFGGEYDADADMGSDDEDGSDWSTEEGAADGHDQARPSFSHAAAKGKVFILGKKRPGTISTEEQTLEEKRQRLRRKYEALPYGTYADEALARGFRVQYRVVRDWPPESEEDMRRVPDEMCCFGQQMYRAQRRRELSLISAISGTGARSNEGQTDDELCSDVEKDKYEDQTDV